MNNQIFPSDLSIIKNNINIETLKEFAQGWDIEYMQMQRGAMNLSFRVIHTPHIQLAFETYEKGVLIKGKYPENAVVLAVVHAEGNANFKQNILRKNELIIAHSNEELDFLSYKASAIFTISVEETLFYSSFYHYFSKEGIYLLRNKQVFIKPDHIIDFKEKITKWIDFLSHRPIIKGKYHSIEKEILNDIFSTIIIERKTLPRAKFDISEVRKDLDKNLKSSISIPELSKKYKISERQLHNTFKSTYGYTPKQYVNNLRLNAIRQILLKEKGTVISKLTAEFQYFHMGHFSKEYKKMFGEVPSQTRKNFTKQ